MRSLSMLKNQAGFTIIEVLIAVTIFLFGILAVGAMQITSIQGNSKSRLIAEAGNAAASAMDQLLLLEYSPGTTAADLLDDDGDGNMKAGLTVAQIEAGLDDDAVGTADGNSVVGGYSLFWNIADDYPRDDVKTIRVIVDWNERGVARTLSLTNVKAME